MVLVAQGTLIALMAAAAWLDTRAPEVGRPLLFAIWFLLISCFGLFAGRMMRAVNAARRELGMPPQGHERQTVLLMRLFAVVLVAAAIWALAVGEISLQPE